MISVSRAIMAPSLPMVKLVQARLIPYRASLIITAKISQRGVYFQGALSTSFFKFARSGTITRLAGLGSDRLGDVAHLVAIFQRFMTTRSVLNSK